MAGAISAVRLEGDSETPVALRIVADASCVTRINHESHSSW